MRRFPTAKRWPTGEACEGALPDSSGSEALRSTSDCLAKKKEEILNTPVSRVLVVGATGSVGRLVVTEGLRSGYSVRVLVRHASQARQFPPEVELAVGDLTRTESLAPALDGVDAIVFTHGSYGAAPGPEVVDYGAVRNVLTALGKRRARIALMTTIGVTDRKGTHDWKRRGERLVRASSLPYTIVRPGWFDMNDPDQNRLVLLQGDKRQSGTPSDGVVSRHELAHVLIWSLQSQGALRKTFELVAEQGARQKDLDADGARLDPDEEGALDAAHDMANMPLNKEPVHIREELERVRAVSRRADK
jgi:uncharacterized protein YbjT (DUF2867 family)